MGARCGTGGYQGGCCGPSVEGSFPNFPVGYGLGCWGCPAGCCGYGEGLGIGGPCSCGADCLGGGNICANSDYYDYFCCGCCGHGRSRCCGCGAGVGASRCGGLGYCGGGSCCCLSYE